MAVEVRLPTVLRAAADGAASVAGRTAPRSARCSPSSSAQYPGLAASSSTTTGGLHKFVNVYVNDDDIRYLDQLDTKVADGDVVSILPAVAGG